MNKQLKLSIAFILYKENSYKYLAFFLSSLKEALTKIDIEYNVLVFDNSPDFIDNRKFVEDFFTKNELEKSLKFFDSSVNLGFAKAFNTMINHAVSNDHDLFLAINPDIVLDPTSLKNLIDYFALNSDQNRIASLSPKILRWDFENNKKTNIVDSLGIALNSYHKFYDNKQGYIDSDLEDGSIFGASGAAALYNLVALKDISHYNGLYYEFFDELMFMYKEDVDLSYRLQLASWRSFVVEDAVVFHDRSLAKKKMSLLELFALRKNKLKSWSLLNQLILMTKIKNIKFSRKIKLKFCFRYLLLWIYAFIFNFSIIKKLYQNRREIKNKGIAIVDSESSISYIESLMKN